MGIEEINIEPLEKVTDNTANPTTECLYPQCEKCSRYVGLGGVYYCTVPMVINKQIWLVTASKIRMLERCLAELQTTVFDHILGDVTQPAATLVCANCTHYKAIDGEFGECATHGIKVTHGSYCNEGVFEP